jgi:sodium/hydrogen exchanger 8
MGIYILIDFGVLIFSRFFTVFFMASVVALLKGKWNNGLSFKELILVGFSGMIRGSIAYALIVKLANSGDEDPVFAKYT